MPFLTLIAIYCNNIHLMKAYPNKVKIIFGEDDKYLNKHIAKQFHEIFPNSELHLIKDARHFVQMDKPEEVANLIKLRIALG